MMRGLFDPLFIHAEPAHDRRDDEVQFPDEEEDERDECGDGDDLLPRMGMLFEAPPVNALQFVPQGGEEEIGDIEHADREEHGHRRIVHRMPGRRVAECLREEDEERELRGDGEEGFHDDGAGHEADRDREESEKDGEHDPYERRDRGIAHDDADGVEHRDRECEHGDGAAEAERFGRRVREGLLVHIHDIPILANLRISYEYCIIVRAAAGMPHDFYHRTGEEGYARAVEVGGGMVCVGSMPFGFCLRK